MWVITFYFSLFGVILTPKSGKTPRSSAAPGAKRRGDALATGKAERLRKIRAIRVSLLFPNGVKPGNRSCVAAE